MGFYYNGKKSYFAVLHSAEKETITVPENLKKAIGRTATELKAEDLQGFTAIGKYGMAYNEALTSVEIPESVTSIGEYAFTSCTALENVTIPNSLTSLGNKTFNGCNKLIYNTDANINYLGNAENPYIVAMVAAYTTNFTNAFINPNTKFINSLAFKNCKQLATVNFHSGILGIGEEAFRYCTALTSADLSKTQIKEILINTFSNCTALTSATLPASVTSIAGFSFDSCTSLATLTMLPTTPPTISSSYGLLSLSSLKKIIVPKGTLSAYQSATNWSTKASIMVEAT